MLPLKSLHLIYLALTITLTLEGVMMTAVQAVETTPAQQQQTATVSTQQPGSTIKVSIPTEATPAGTVNTTTGSTPTTVKPVPTTANKAATPPKAKTTYNLSAEAEELQLTDDIALAKRQMKAHPEDPEARFLYAAALSRSPYLEKAYKEIKKVKTMLKEKKDFEFIDRTLVEYEAMGKDNPNNSIVQYRLALAYFLKAYSVEKYPHHYKNTPVGTSSEFYGKAQQTMQRVIALTPSDVYARNYLGVLVSESGKDLTKAIPIWEESLKIDKENNPGAYLLLSQAYLQQGDFAKSLVYGAKGLEIKERMGMTLPK